MARKVQILSEVALADRVIDHSRPISTIFRHIQNVHVWIPYLTSVQSLIAIHLKLVFPNKGPGGKSDMVDDIQAGKPKEYHGASGWCCVHQCEYLLTGQWDVDVAKQIGVNSYNKIRAIFQASDFALEQVQFYTEYTGTMVNYG